jgi:hypothetical protein
MRRHHAESQQIHLDDAQVGAVFLVPLHNHAARHAGGFERHHLVQTTLADHHASGVLSQVARQVLQRHHQFQELADARMVEVEPGFAERLLGLLGMIMPTPARNQFGERVECADFEAQHLAGLPGGHASAVGYDVGRHGGAQLSIARVDVLDHALALLAARQIKIDIRPLAALFGEKALEQQVHADRVNRGDAQ